MTDTAVAEKVDEVVGERSIPAFQRASYPGSSMSATVSTLHVEIDEIEKLISKLSDGLFGQEAAVVPIAGHSYNGPPNVAAGLKNLSAKLSGIKGRLTTMIGRV